jgi:hypothetical protein
MFVFCSVHDPSSLFLLLPLYAELSSLSNKHPTCHHS